MSNKETNLIPDAPPIRQEQGNPSDGETPTALFVKSAAPTDAGEVPTVTAAPTQEQTGVSDVGQSAANVVRVSEETQAALSARAATPLSDTATRALRENARLEQEASQAKNAEAMLQSQATQAQAAIIPSGLELSRPMAKAVVVDTGNKTGNGLSTSTLRDINNIPRRQATNVAASGITEQGNIVRQNPRLVAQQAAKEAAKAESAKLKEDLEVILRDVPAAYRSDVIRLEQYCVTMAPGRPVSDQQGGAEQVALFRLLQNIINRQTVYFTPLFTAVLRIFRTNIGNGPLGDAYRNRFGHHIPLSAQERKALQKITHLLSVMADPKTRAMATQIVDIEAALEDGLTDEGRNRVSSFFG